MASRGLGYDYGTAGSGAGGKIRRHPASRVVASPYARPAAAPALAAAAATDASQVGGWFSRLISAGASRLLATLFRKPPAQLAAPPLRPEASQEPLLLWQDVGPAFVQTQPEPLNGPPSPPPPPLEDDIPEGKKSSIGAVANVLATENSTKDGEQDILRNSDGYSVLDLEDLLKQRTFKRSEFEYLSKLLWSRTVGSKSLKPDDGNEKETGSMRSNLPSDFFIGTRSVSDLVASPAEIAKAYMGSKSANGSSLRLRLHDPSSLTIKSMEANVTQQARPPTIPLQGSRLRTSNTSDFSTSNRLGIYKISSSPYFKSANSSDDSFSNVSSSYETPSSVHTFGRQVLKRKSTAINSEIISVGPIRKMRQRYNRASPLLETRPIYRGHLGRHGNKLNEDSENSMQTQKCRCLGKVRDATLGGLDDATATSFNQAPVQSAEMAAKILKQLDALVPSQKEVTPEINQKHGDVMGVETPVSHKKEVSVQSNLSEPSTSGVKEYSINGINGNVTCALQVTEKSSDTTSNTSASLTTESISQIKSLKDKPATFSSRSHPPNLVLSSEVDRNKMPITPSGFTFPVPAVLGTHSQAPPTPTMASPPILPVEKLQPIAASSASVMSMESGPRIPKSVMEEGSIAQKCDKMLNSDDKLMSSKSSGHVTSFTSNPVFKFANSKSATMSNGLQHTSVSIASDIFTANGSISRALSASSGSYIVSTNSASVSSRNVSTVGSFAISSTGTSSLSAVTGATALPFTTASLVSSGAGSSSAPFSLFPQFGTASSSATQDKTKAASSSGPFNFSQQFVTASSFAAQDNSKVAAPESTILSGNQYAQPGNSNTMFTQDSACNLNFKPAEQPTGLNLPNLPVVSAPLGSPLSLSALFSSAAGSGSTTMNLAFSPISSSAPLTDPAFSASPVFGSKLTTTATPSAFLNYGSATSPLSSAPNAVFSFTAATPSIPNLSPTTPIFGGVSLATGSTTGAQINGCGNMITDRKESPFSTTSPFRVPSNSPSTPIFSSPATQFAPTTSPSPEAFKFGDQNTSSGAFSIGTTSSVNEKYGRKFIRVKRKK